MKTSPTQSENANSLPRQIICTEATPQPLSQVLPSTPWRSRAHRPPRIASALRGALPWTTQSLYTLTEKLFSCFSKPVLRRKGSGACQRVKSSLLRLLDVSGARCRPAGGSLSLTAKKQLVVEGPICGAANQAAETQLRSFFSAPQRIPAPPHPAAERCSVLRYDPRSIHAA